MNPFRIFSHAKRPYTQPRHINFCLHDASYIYDNGTTGLRATTLNIEERRVAIIGLNGSGKTTLLNLLNTTVAPTSGSVLIQTETESYNTANKRERMAIAPSIGALRVQEIEQRFPKSSNIREALEQVLNKQHSEQSTLNSTIVADILAQYGLSSVSSLPLAGLNNKQRHLAAIALATAGNPCALVADEPTKGLDERDTSEVATKLLATQRQIVIATHDISLIARPEFAFERVLIVDNQSVVYDGAPTNAAGYFSDLIASAYQQAGGHTTEQ